MTADISRGRARWRLAHTIVEDAGTSLLRRPAHAVGMMSGILLAVASASAAVAIADTQQNQVDLQFDLQRSSHAVIRSETPTAQGFPPEQVDLVSALEPVAAVGEFSEWSDRMSVSRSTTSVAQTAPVLVSDPGGFAATSTHVVSGASADLLRTSPDTRIVWVGEQLARRLGVSPAGDDHWHDSQVVMGGVAFSVAGLIRNDAGFTYADNAIMMSRPLAVATLGGAGRNVRLVADVRPGAAGAVAEYIVGTADPTGELGLENVTPADGEQLLGRVGNDLRRFGAAIGGLVGAVGMIAIANTLMMSVHQRSRELGLRSAMGWSRRRIGLLVLTESAVAGVVAGVLGSGIGVAAAAAWCWSHGWTLVMPSALPLIVVVGGLAASIAGGLLPAWRAASVSPLEAMRS